MRPWLLKETNYGTVKEHHYEVAVLPFGATEPHNLHLPYGIDALEADAVGEHICEAAWQRGAKIMLLPTIDLIYTSGKRFFNPDNINFSPPSDFFLCTMKDRLIRWKIADARIPKQVSPKNTDKVVRKRESARIIGPAQLWIAEGKPVLLQDEAALGPLGIAVLKVGPPIPGKCRIEFSRYGIGLHRAATKIEAGVMADRTRRTINDKMFAYAINARASNDEGTRWPAQQKTQRRNNPQKSIPHRCVHALRSR